MRALPAFIMLLIGATHLFAQAAADKPAATSTEAPVIIETAATDAPLPAAMKLLRDGRYEQAATAFRALIGEGRNPLATAGLVRALLRMDDLSSASEVIKKALKDYPGEAAIHQANGEVLYRSGVLWDAEVEFANTINKWGPNAQAYLWLSRIYTASAYHKKSRLMIERAYKIDPDDPEVASAYHRATRRSQTLAMKMTAGDDKGEKDDSVQQLLRHVGGGGRRTCSVVGGARELQVPLVPLHTDAQHIHGFGLDMTFNGQRGRLLLDTGANGILINRRLADRAGVKRITSSTIHGIGDKGGTAGYWAHIDSVKIGGLELRDCTVEVSNTRNVLDDDGLIGTDLFEEFLVRIDFPHTKFKLSALPPRPGEAPKPEANKLDPPATAPADAEPELQDPYRAPDMDRFTRMYRVGHYILVPTRINDLPLKLFLLDTGAFNNMISPAAAREVTKVHDEDEFKIKGLSGAVKQVYMADQATLQFSRYRQKNQDLVAFDLSGLSRSAGMEISGALGFAMLRLMEVSIDYRDGMVDFEYDPKLFPGLR